MAELAQVFDLRQFEQGNKFRIQVTKSTGEFVGEAEGRTEAGRNYDKIIADYKRNCPNRRRYSAEGVRLGDTVHVEMSRPMRKFGSNYS